MTVSELIEKLKECDQSAQVVCYSEECEYLDFYNVNTIEEINNKVRIYHT